jgi:hypothetical protein
MTEPGAPPSIPLESLAGGAAPPDIADDLRVLTRLPLSARERIWEALGPCLVEVIGPDVEGRLDHFCQTHGVPDGDLARVIKACRFLIREASVVDADRDAFARDLGRLCPDLPALGEILLPGYDLAKAQVRAEILSNTLADHGKLVEGIDWSVDVLSSSSRGERLGLPVIVLTFRYREGTRRDRITLRFVPAFVQRLREICDRIVR